MSCIESSRGTATHAVKEGAAATLFAANLRNPPHSALKEVLSTAKDIVLRDDLSNAVTGSTTFAESGASGRVAIFVTCKYINILLIVVTF